VLAKPLFAVLVCLSLAACGLPRGAGFQAEVLGTAATQNDNAFATYDVNTETLPRIQAWGGEQRAPLNWPVSQDQPASLIIAPGDTVQLTIWDAEENSIFGPAGVTPLQPTEVDAAGRIFVPFIGELRVSGMSPSTARQRIEEELVMTVPSAQVQLVVEPGQGNTANLSSGVAAPGLYPLPRRDFRILDLFSLAGGVDRSLNAPQVRLVRNNQTFGVAFAVLEQNPNLNIAVRGGDRIYVIDDDRKFITLGATGSQSIVDFPESELSALEAIAFIGGVNAGTANPESVLIMREYEASQVRDGITGPPEEQVVFIIDLPDADGLFAAGRFMIEDCDLIYGTESALGPFLAAVGLGNTVTNTLN
jgi:polysaccharide export outer membrane protein